MRLTKGREHGAVSRWQGGWSRLWSWKFAACCLLGLAMAGAVQQVGSQDFPPPIPASSEPITPLPYPPNADPLKVALGEALFDDRRLSHDGSFACSSCHDVQTNGADPRRRTAARAGSAPQLSTLTVFNAALNFRLNWEGNLRTLEAQALSSVTESAHLASSVGEVVAKLNDDPHMVGRFEHAYGHRPDEASLLDAIATYERSLLTPDSRFDLWLKGDASALTPMERDGFALFKSLGCASCHQGVNIGGNLYERHGIFRPIGSPLPEVLRVPSLRNVATLAPYFHDGSAPTLRDAVRTMSEAQLGVTVTDQQVDLLVAFLNTLTGRFHGRPVLAGPP
jgi:cytochrome c peroxidase